MLDAKVRPAKLPAEFKASTNSHIDDKAVKPRIKVAKAHTSIRQSSQPS